MGRKPRSSKFDSGVYRLVDLLQPRLAIGSDLACADAVRVESSVELFKEGLRSLLPDDLSGAIHWAPPTAHFQYPREAELMDGAVPSRQCEFIGGRQCARTAVEELGVISQEILKDAEGLPIWPAGLVGSISHSRGLCGAVVGSRDRYSCIGLDIERTDRLSDSALRRVMHPKERECLGQSQWVGSVLFSAKEAFFKAQYPVYGRKPTFHDLILSIYADEGSLRVEGIDHMDATMQSIVRRMEFRFFSQDAYVITVCLLAGLN
jgi:4'-phosphopantetheinyl transferase EntD